MKRLDELKQFNEKVQNEVKRILTCYDECNVYLVNDEYQITPDIFWAKGLNIKSITTFKAEEIFTEAERNENYKNIFGCICYPKLKGYDTIE